MEKETVVVLPALGESVTEGTITCWLKQVGDGVDEPLVEASIDKVDTEIPSPLAGTLLEIKVEQAAVAEVGAALALIGSSNQSNDDPTPSRPRSRRPRPPSIRRILEGESTWLVS